MKKWLCPRCGFENKTEATHCKGCDEPKNWFKLAWRSFLARTNRREPSDQQRRKKRTELDDDTSWEKAEQPPNRDRAYTGAVSTVVPPSPPTVPPISLGEDIRAQVEEQIAVDQAAEQEIDTFSIPPWLDGSIPMDNPSPTPEEAQANTGDTSNIDSFEGLRAEMAELSRQFAELRTRTEEAVSQQHGAIREVSRDFTGARNELKQDLEGLKSDHEGVTTHLGELSTRLDVQRKRLDSQEVTLRTFIENVNAVLDQGASTPSGARVYPTNSNSLFNEMWDGMMDVFTLRVFRRKP